MRVRRRNMTIYDQPLAVGNQQQLGQEDLSTCLQCGGGVSPSSYACLMCGGGARRNNSSDDDLKSNCEGNGFSDGNPSNSSVVMALQGHSTIQIIAAQNQFTARPPQQQFVYKNSNGAAQTHAHPGSNFLPARSSYVTTAAAAPTPTPEPQRRDPRLGQNADDEERIATEQGRKCFVGNLKRPITRNEVLTHFGKFGDVERVILSQGFGLVIMTTREGALQATAERWQALGWRNVEVFVYEKGQKGASWTRPYSQPPFPGPCVACPNTAAEHCSLCTSSLCLKENTMTCTTVCHACLRSFCGGTDCQTQGLESCLACGALVCFYCGLRLGAVCGKCGVEFPHALVEDSKKRAKAHLSSHIGDNRGSVYALVCLLKGDVESVREGQLVAAIDRASKCFDPRANSWCTIAAKRAVAELNESWEVTKWVHNLRALRRCAKQWSTDLTTLMTSSPSRAAVAAKLSEHRGNVSPAPPAIAGCGFVAKSSPAVSLSANPSANLSFSANPNSPLNIREVFYSSIRTGELLLLEFDPRPKGETDWLISNLRHLVVSFASQRQIRYGEELAQRMEIWSMLLRRTAVAVVGASMDSPINSFVSLTFPMERLQKVILQADMFFVQAKTPDEYVAKKDRVLIELICLARDVKKTSSSAAIETLLRRAGRTARNIETRYSFYSQGLLHFEACLHQSVYCKCQLGAACPFMHFAASASDRNSNFDGEFIVPDFEFSNEDVALGMIAAAKSGMQQQQFATSRMTPVNWSHDGGPTSAFSNSWPKSGKAGVANAQFSSWGRPDIFLQSPRAPSPGISPWPNAISYTDNRSNNPLMTGSSSSYTNYGGGGMDSVNLKSQIERLCFDLGFENFVLAEDLTATFLACGALNCKFIWDVDVVSLHRELLKINLSPAMRVKILNLITERRSIFTDISRLGD